MTHDELLKLLEERDLKIELLEKTLLDLVYAARHEHEHGGVPRLYTIISKAEKLLSDKDNHYE
jgi:hypothetical protein